jgi:hypothetical protein
VRVGITAGFGGLIGADTLASLKFGGWAIARIGKQVAQTTPLHELVAEVQTAGLTPVIHCQPSQLVELPDDVDVELNHPTSVLAGTEPNGLVDPVVFATAMNAAVLTIQAKRLRAWTCLTGTDRSSLRWTATVLETLDPVFAISVHRYPPSNAESVEASASGGREFESAALHAIIGNRPYCVGECGYNQGPYQRWYDRLLFRHRHFTLDRLRELTLGEMIYWRDHGASFVCLYQLNDAPLRCSQHPDYPDTWINGFGIRRQPGDIWKPSLSVPSDPSLV